MTLTKADKKVKKRNREQAVKANLDEMCRYADEKARENFKRRPFHIK